jgi:type I restriction enzyme S subunit
MSNNNYKITEAGQIPLSWNVVEIQEISEVKTGGTPSKSKPEYWDGDIKWMASGDIHLRKVYDVPQRISKLGFENSNVKLLPRKTVMIALNGQGKTRGTVAILETELTCNQSLAGFTPSGKFVPEYLFYNLQNRYSEIRNLTGDGARNGLNLAILREIKVALPSLYEQGNIATILSSVDEAIEKTEAIIEQTEKVKRGLMQLLLTKGIGHTKFKKTEIGEIPAVWELVQIQDIGRLKSGTTPSRSEQERYFENGTIPWVKTMDLNNGEVISTNERITDVALEETSLTLLPVNTVLVAMYGGFKQIGRTGILREKATINQALTGIVVNETIVIPYYLQWWLNAKVDYWKNFAASSRKDPNITKSDVLKFPVTLPALSEQQKIVDILSSVNCKIEKEMQKLFHLRELKKGLMQSLLTGKVRVKVDEAEVTKV